jgi:ketosteroid isomerase-like protein
MSQENVEVVRAVLDAQRRRDWEAFPDLYDPEIEWEDVSGLWGDWGTRRGFEDVQAAWLAWFEAFEHVEFDIEEILAADHDVLTSIRVSGRGRGSGLQVEQSIAVVWTVRDRRVVRVRGYRERNKALEAAGLAQEPSG